MDSDLPRHFTAKPGLWGILDKKHNVFMDDSKTPNLQNQNHCISQKMVQALNQKEQSDCRYCFHNIKINMESILAILIAP